MTHLSNWREESDLFEVVTGKMTDEKALRKVDEKKGIKNKVVINPKLTETIKNMGGELIEATEEEGNVDPAKKKAEEQKKKQIENKQKRAQMIKKQVLMKKLIAVRAGSEDIVAGYKPEGEVLDERLGGKGYKSYKSLTGKKVSGDWEDSDRGAGNKSARRAGKKVEKKSPTYLAHVHNKEEVVHEGEELKEYSPTLNKRGGGKLGKSSIYSIKDKDESKKSFRKSHVKDVEDGYVGGGHKPTPGNFKKEEVVNEGDVHSGQGEKIQKRTKAWMDKKGQKGAPGLDAIKARTAEHKSKRGVKEEVIDERTLSSYIPSDRKGEAHRANLDYMKAQLKKKEDESTKNRGDLSKRDAGKMAKERLRNKKIMEDKALELVRANIIKKHGKGAIYDPKNVKKPSKADQAKAAAERKKRQDADNKAYSARARKAGYKNTQDYTNVVARYGSEDNMKKGKGLGT